MSNRVEINSEVEGCFVKYIFHMFLKLLSVEIDISESSGPNDELDLLKLFKQVFGVGIRCY